MLKVDNLHVYYGHIHAVKGVSFDVQDGEILTLIGANGAGKSTIMKTVTGILKPRQGDVILDGSSIRGLRPEKVVTLGVGYVPEGRNVFPVMTVEENLEIGAYHRKDHAGVEKDKARMFEMFTVFVTCAWAIPAARISNAISFFMVARSPQRCCLLRL